MLPRERGAIHLRPGARDKPFRLRRASAEAPRLRRRAAGEHVGSEMAVLMLIAGAAR